MDTIKHPTGDQTSTSQPILKRCLHCAGNAELTTASNPLRHGVICLNCPVEIPPVLLSQELAIRLWNQAKGTASAFGGRSTSGLSTRKKRRACRRNLKRAREKRKLVWIRKRIDLIYSELKPFREAELAEAEAALAQSLAELKELEPRIMKYPTLARFYREIILKQKPAPMGTDAEYLM